MSLFSQLLSFTSMCYAVLETPEIHLSLSHREGIYLPALLTDIQSLLIPIIHSILTMRTTLDQLFN